MHLTLIKLEGTLEWQDQVDLDIQSKVQSCGYLPFHSLSIWGLIGATDCHKIAPIWTGLISTSIKIAYHKITPA